MKNHKRRKPKPLGQVERLESYLSPDWWKRIFDSLYLKTDADVVCDERITKEEVDLFLDILKPDKESRILDLCCGQGRHSLEMARRGFINVEGLDRSRYLIRKAKAKAKEENLPVRFREGDARNLPYPSDTFDFVMIVGNSFGYFDNPNDDVRILREVFRVLKPYGKVLLDLADGDYLSKNYQKMSWEWIDKKRLVCRERELSSDKTRLISREIIIHVEKGVIADRFYAERLYSRELIREVLEEVGFTEITFHTEILTNSQRNQDLGMMERRIVVSAIAKKEPSRREVKGKKTVVVLLGDSSKPDPVKPYGIFDEDDIEAIAELKKALRDLKGYEFIFLENHDNLIQTLEKLKAKTDIVFNLCDEGFQNDPRKELHIPALLEILNIPYTGSPPHCLAVCYDKSIVRAIAKDMGIPVPKGILINPEDTKFKVPFGFPVIIKPAMGDGGFGITKENVVNSFEEFINVISNLRGNLGYDKPILVEEFLTGKDLTFGIIGNPPDHISLPIIEEDYSSLPDGYPKICGYEAKWLSDSPYWGINSVPADLPRETEKFIKESSLKLFERLGCRDYCRFDWRLDEDGNPRLLEVNPNPSWCWDGHLAKMAKFAGISYKEMLKLILESALKRIYKIPTNPFIS
jgi:D-alanine-D-alanine ligase